MRLEELDFSYPEELVATKPQEPCRIFYGTEGCEISRADLFQLFQAGDTLVINDTQVEKRRVFSPCGLEVLFLNPISDSEWEVLFPARDTELNENIALPGDLTMTLKQKGLPQIVELSRSLGAEYFKKYGELALPPYIQKARGERHNSDADSDWYQTDWAKHSGSAASPTASLHFSKGDLKELEKRGVQISRVTLHVGMGTFLPIKSQNLNDHTMHGEWYEIPDSALDKIEKTKSQGRKVWALGTTVIRTLESYAQTGLKTDVTQLFIQPGFAFQVVDGLLTNFHQPKSTLLALVAAFHGDIEAVKQIYQKAIEEKFRLFSYGDLTVWMR